MSEAFDVRKSDKPFDQTHTLVAVIELSQASWLVGGLVPGLMRSPLKKLEPKKERLLELLVRWRDEALRAGHEIKRFAVACECGRDGFWLARWLTAQGIEAYVIHAASVAVSREHRRAKTDRLWGASGFGETCGCGRRNRNWRTKEWIHRLPMMSVRSRRARRARISKVTAS